MINSSIGIVIGLIIALFIMHITGIDSIFNKSNDGIIQKIDKGGEIKYLKILHCTKADYLKQEFKKEKIK